MSRGKKRLVEFGKRGLEQTEATEGQPTALERLKKVGMRWWGAGHVRKMGPLKKGFPRPQL